MSEDTQTRVEFDEHGKRTTYDEIEIGKDLGSLDWVVGEEDIEKQCAIDEDYHPWFAADAQGDGPEGDGNLWEGLIAPPQIHYRPPRWLLSRTYNIRGVACAILANPRYAESAGFFWLPSRSALDELIAGQDRYEVELQCEQLQLSERGDLLMLGAATDHDWSLEALSVDALSDLDALTPRIQEVALASR